MGAGVRGLILGLGLSLVVVGEPVLIAILR